MAYVETPWTRLASRTMRGLLTRKGATYEETAQRLRILGADESTRSVEGKATRGTYTLSFFLLILLALEADRPTRWDRILRRRGTIEEKAAHIFLLELESHSLDPGKVAKHLAKLGTETSVETLHALLASGTFQFVLLLQLAALADISGLERYVDRSDILAVATDARHASKT